MSREREEEGENIYDPDKLNEDETEVRDFEDWQQEAGKSGEEPRKRLVKRSAREDVEEGGNFYDSASKGTSKDSSDGDQREKNGNLETKDCRHRKSGSGIADKLMKLGRGGGEGEKEMNEMCQDYEDDGEGPRTRDDDNFIDDTGVDEVQYISAGEEPAGDAPQAEEADEDNELKKNFQPGKKSNKKIQRRMMIEQFMARIEAAAEDDVNCNRLSQPAINKLKMLPELVLMLEKRQLQQEFLDRGVLSVLKNWLEPLPDGSLPNLNIRSTLLKLLTDLPIDVEQHERRDQLKNGIGKVVVFLSKLPEETRANRKLARDLLDRWSRPRFAKSTRSGDLRQIDANKAPVRRPLSTKPAAAPTRDSRPGDCHGKMPVRPSGSGARARN